MQNKCISKGIISFLIGIATTYGFNFQDKINSYLLFFIVATSAYFCCCLITPIVSNMSFSRKIKNILVFLAVGAFALIVTPIMLSEQMLIQPWYLRALIMCADCVVIGFFFGSSMLWLVSREASLQNEQKDNHLAGLYYTGILFVVWSVWLLLFWPGVMSADSITQWGQMLSGHYNDHQPTFHTLTNWVITRIYLSPATIAITQIIALAVTVSWGLTTIEKLGASKTIIWITLALFALSPVNGLMIITLWKDIAYSISVLVLSIILIKIVSTKGKYLDSWQTCIFLSIVTTLVMLYRTNGIPIGLGVLFLLFFCFSQFRKFIITATFISIALLMVVRGPLFSTLHVARDDARYLLVAHHIAAHVAAKTPQALKDKKYLDTIRDTSDSWDYSCVSQNPTVFNPKFHLDPIFHNKKLFYKEALKLAMADPLVELKHTICVSAVVWRITTDGNYPLFAISIGHENQKLRTIIDNPFGLKEHSYFPNAAEKLSRTWMIANQPDLIWRPAIYLYLLICAVGVACVRSSSLLYALILAPAGLNSLTLLIFNVAYDMRYQYSVYLVSLLVSLWLMFGIKKAKA